MEYFFETHIKRKVLSCSLHIWHFCQIIQTNTMEYIERIEKQGGIIFPPNFNIDFLVKYWFLQAQPGIFGVSITSTIIWQSMAEFDFPKIFDKNGRLQACQNFREKKSTFEFQKTVNANRQHSQKEIYSIIFTKLDLILPSLSQKQCRRKVPIVHVPGPILRGIFLQNLHQMKAFEFQFTLV